MVKFGYSRIEVVAGYGMAMLFHRRTKENGKRKAREEEGLGSLFQGEAVIEPWDKKDRGVGR